MAGEKHYLTCLRVYFPEYARELGGKRQLRRAARGGAARHHARIARPHGQPASRRSPKTRMPGELANCIAGRIANIFNFHGPNFVTRRRLRLGHGGDQRGGGGLVENDFDVAVTGGIDRNMGAPRLREVLQDRRALGDRHAALRGRRRRLRHGRRRGDLPAEAPGRRRARRRQDLRRAARHGRRRATARERASPRPTRSGRRSGHRARLGECRPVAGHRDPASKATAHPRAWAMWWKSRAWRTCSASTASTAGAIALGSVKSNIGHLKGAAGAAGILKTALALRDKVLPPSVHCEHPNPNIDFAHSPLYVNTRTAAVDGDGGWRPARGRERLWIWRHQFPCRARRIHSAPADRQRQAVGGGRRGAATDASRPAERRAGQAANASAPQGAVCAGRW